MFNHVVLFKIEAGNLVKDDLELELIDFGLEDISFDEENKQYIIQNPVYRLRKYAGRDGGTQN